MSSTASDSNHHHHSSSNGDDNSIDNNNVLSSSSATSSPSSAQLLPQHQAQQQQQQQQQLGPRQTLLISVTDESPSYREATSTSGSSSSGTHELRLESYPFLDMPLLPGGRVADFPPSSSSTSTTSSSSTTFTSSPPSSTSSIPFSSLKTSTSSSSSTTATSAARSQLPSMALEPLLAPNSTSALNDKILHFTTTLAAAAAAGGADGKKEANIDELQRKLHFYQVMLWLKRSYILGGQTSLTKRCVYQDYSNMCTESGTPCLFSPSVFGKVIKRTFPDLQYRRRRINRRINAHYEGLERVPECFDAAGYPRAMPLQQEEELAEAERLQLEFYDKKIGGKQNKQSSGKRGSPEATSKRTSAAPAKRQRKKDAPDGQRKVKQESGSARRRQTGADDDDYLPEDERRTDSDDSSSGGSQPYDETDHIGAEPQPPIDQFWRDWTLPGEAQYAVGPDGARHDLRGGSQIPQGLLPHMPGSGQHAVDGFDSLEPSFHFMSYLEAGSSGHSSYSSSATSAAWRPPPLPSHALLQHASQQQPVYSHQLPSMPTFPTPFHHQAQADQQSRLLPWPSAMGQSPTPGGSYHSSASGINRPSPSSSSPHALMQSFPLPSTAPSSTSSSFPASSASQSMLANHPCPCPSCLSGRPAYYSPYH